MSSFYEFVDNVLQKALPLAARRIPQDKLPGKEPCRIRHAFLPSPINGKSGIINILVLPQSFGLIDHIEDQLIKLRDYILSKNCLLVVISEEEKTNSLGNVGDFIDQRLAIPSPNFLWLRCFQDKEYRTTIDHDLFEGLDVVIRELWEGSIDYVGPTAGEQQVNLELMEDQCWSCHRPMRTVTGIAFPNKQLSRWDNPDWMYYNQLLPLSSLEGGHARMIRQYVDQLRTANPLITPVGNRYSHTVQESYFAASCPHCKVLRGDFHVMDDRMRYLHSLDSRSSGQLEYHSIMLRVNDKLLSALREGAEFCPHACWMGWERKPVLTLLRPQQGN